MQPLKFPHAEYARRSVATMLGNTVSRSEFEGCFPIQGTEDYKIHPSVFL